MKVEILPHERIDDLQFKGLRIIQNPLAFCFGTDAVLLADFALMRKAERVIDLGSGTGIIPILLAGRAEDARIVGIEIQEAMVEMASRSIRLNDLEDRVEIMQGDIRQIPGVLGKGGFDVVVSNPPYKKEGSGMVNRMAPHAIARHEILCTLEDVIRTAADLLRNHGRFSMVHQTDRMLDILFLMRKYAVEPKRIRLVHPNTERPPNLLLVEGVRGGKPGLHWMPPLFMYDKDGRYTAEMNRIYHREG